VTSSGSYGHRVNKSLAFVFVPPEYAVPGTTFDIEILSQRRKAKVLAEPAYDPKNKRLRA
jgi:dimethylglycine dehydrogenase